MRYPALVTSERIRLDPGRDAEARMAVPTPEHYLPLLYALALQESDEPAEMFNTRVISSISMNSLVIVGPLPA